VPPKGSASPGGSVRPGLPVGEQLQAADAHQSANIGVKLLPINDWYISFHTDKNRYYT